MDPEDVEITVDFNDSESFLDFDETALSFSMEQDLAIEGIYKVFIDLVYESELGVQTQSRTELNFVLGQDLVVE